jgi:hypothetical protein
VTKVHRNFNTSISCAKHSFPSTSQGNDQYGRVHRSFGATVARRISRLTQHDCVERSSTMLVRHRDMLLAAKLKPVHIATSSSQHQSLALNPSYGHDKCRLNSVYTCTITTVSTAWVDDPLCYTKNRTPLPQERCVHHHRPVGASADGHSRGTATSFYLCLPKRDVD